MAGFAHFRKDLFKVIVYPLLGLMIFSAGSMDNYKKELKDVEKEIKKNEELIKNASRKENVTLSDIEHIDHELEKSKKEMNRYVREVRKLNSEIGKMGQQIQQLEKDFFLIKGKVRAALGKWYALGTMQKSYSAFFAYDFDKNVLKYEVLRRLNEKNRKYVRQLLKTKEELIQKNDEYSIRSNQIQKVRKLVELKSSNIENEKDLKNTYLGKLKKEKNRYRDYLVGLEEKKNKINRQIKDMIRKEMEKRRNTETKTVAKKDLGKIGVTIANYKTKLNLNISGKIVSRFGKSVNEEFGISINNDGIELEKVENELFSPISGKIIFSDWLKGKGNVIIISVDERFAAVFANLSEVYVSKGQKIKKSDLLGKVMADHGGKNILYFSTWIDGNPFDPELLIMR